jgi:hypothetical protein
LKAARLAALAAIMAIGATGCFGVGTEYEWTRKDPALFRRSPTTFHVRLKVLPAQNLVLWLQSATDADGPIDTEIDSLAGCAFFDSNNWEWNEFGDSHRRVSMRKGKLHESYWGEERDFREVHRFLGRRVSWP